MIRVAVTQRVVTAPGYQERRDALDQRWAELLIAIGAWPILIPNNERYAEALFTEMAVDALLLTGGDSLATYGGRTPERDRVERRLLSAAIERGLPVVGVCRGMQVIQQAFKVPLERVAGHVATRHKLTVSADSRYAAPLAELDTVNAFHEIGATASVPELQITARSADGVVMAVEHHALPVYAQMWHPEREPRHVPADLALLSLALRDTRDGR